MRLSRADLTTMRWSLLAACLSTLVCAAILYGGSRYAEHAQQDQSRAQRQLGEAKNRLAAARLDQENLSAYSGAYRALEADQIIGDEQRLDWVEGLEKLRRQNLVADFHYHIAPQQDYAAMPARGNFHIRYSAMKLEFDLLHETQLADFFDAMRSQIKGRYQLEGCTLQRGAADGNNPALLKAECSGGWVTLKNRNSPQ